MFKSIKRFTAWAVLAVAAISLTGCGDRVEVGPAKIGKIMTSNGYQKGTIPSSKFRMETCFFTACDKLVTLDQSDKSVVEQIEILMPEDKLILRVGVNTTLSVNPAKSESLFATLVPEEDGDKDDMTAEIKWATIYNTYAKNIITSETREFLSKYTIAEVSSNLESITSELRNHLTKVIQARTPFLVRYVGLTNPKYPDIITKAQEGAAQRREQVQTEEAQLQISKVKLERELQEARLTRQIQLEKAQTEAAGNRAQAETITPALLEKQRLENQAAWIEKWDGKLPDTVTADVFATMNRAPNK